MTPELSKPTAQPQTSPPALSPAPLPAAPPRRRSLIRRGGVVRALPVSGAPAPTAMRCLHCQLLGRRQLTCSKADDCAALPQSFAIGPLLLAAWLATTIAFVLAVYGR